MTVKVWFTDIKRENHKNKPKHVLDFSIFLFPLHILARSQKEVIRSKPLLIIFFPLKKVNLKNDNSNKELFHTQYK